MTSRKDWAYSSRYRSHIYAGTVPVCRGQESALVDIVAATPVTNRDGSFTCQHFVLEGLQALVDHGYQSQEWYNQVENELTTELVTGSVG